MSSLKTSSRYGRKQRPLAVKLSIFVGQMLAVQYKREQLRRGPLRLTAKFLWIWATASVVSIGLKPIAAAEPALPGTVVKWSGAEVSKCGVGSREWLPIEDACWYPIDLLALPGRRELLRWTPRGREMSTIEIADYPYEVQRITLQSDSQVNLSATDLSRVRRDQRAVGALWNTASPRRFRLPLAPPLRSLPPGGRFGARRFFNDQPRSPHTGTDYAADDGTEVLSTAVGRVVLSAALFFSGESVFIDHGDGLVSMYFHLKERLVVTGDGVGRGEPIGRVGQTGRATGPHLHFGLRWRGARIDPALLLAGSKGITDLRMPG